MKSPCARLIAVPSLCGALAGIPPVGFVRPCEPTVGARPPGPAGCMKSSMTAGAFSPASRANASNSGRGADPADRFARIAEAVRGLSVDEALIDGEAVVLRDDGRSDFAPLKSAAARDPRSWPLTFCVSKATICAYPPWNV
jgi:hypothetical protein